MEAASSPDNGASSGARTGLIATFVVLWWLGDAVVGIAVMLLAAWGRPLIVFVVAAAVYALINIACCTWINRHWDRWMAKAGKRVETKVQKMRSSRLMKHPVAWIERGTDWWFALAAALTNAITAVVVARLIGGKPLSERRVLVASLAFSLFAAGFFSLIGFVAGDAIRAL